MHYVDLAHVLSLVGVAVLLAVLVAVPAVRRRDWPLATRAASRVLLGGAVVGVVGVTHAAYVLFPDLWSSQRHLNLVPFATIELETARADRGLGLLNVLGNVALFAPVGLFAVLSGWCRLRFAILLGLGVSVLVESAQYVVGRSSDVDDVLLNTLGTVVGALLGTASLRLGRRRGTELRRSRQPSSWR